MYLQRRITGVSPDTWFGPLQPLAPMAPPEVKGRQFDYPFGLNLNYIPRSNDGISFAELRGLADALPLLRAVIETRKDQIAGQSYAVRARSRVDTSDVSKSIDAVSRFLARPDRRHSFADWLRMLVEEMLVIDAATIYPRYARGGALYSLDIIDGATIKPLIGEDGRAPEAPDPAYQQILKGVPAADFSADKLIYLPRNLRSHRLYGMSPVEQIALTVNIALPARRGDPRLLPHRLDPGRFRDAAQGMDGRPDPLVPGLFRRADERQSGATADDQVHARRLQADRDPPAAAERPVRRVAGAAHLLRLLGPGFRFRVARSIARRARPCACRRRRKGWFRSRPG